MISRRSLLAVLLSATAAAALAGCGSDSAAGPSTDTGPSLVQGCTTTPPTTENAAKQYDAPPPMTIDESKTYTATLKTSCGDIVMRLDPKAAPKTVNNFVFLAREKYYDGTTFHRVVPSFVIQGGDPTASGSGGPGYEFDDELPTDGYKIGSVAMANAGPNTNGSQFFIVTGINGTQLPNGYSRFGEVTQGMDVAQRIESLAPPGGDASDPASEIPRQTAWVYSVTIDEK
ncbi:MAG: peptidylprolyl isomerase [Thermoleophilia bacterium]